MALLTKSKHLIGLQCSKYLWIVFNDLKQIPEVGIADEFKFKQGDEVGVLAKKLFPGGIDLVDGNIPFSERAINWSEYES